MLGALLGVALALGDRVYTADQFSNTVSVVDPTAGTLVAQIPLGDPQPQNLSPLYRGQLLVHGLGLSPDRRTLAVVSVGSNSVAWVDTASNAITGITYLGRAPHEAAFTPDGKELWVTVRGEDYVAVLDARTHAETRRIRVAVGPGMTAFAPDGKTAFVCSSFTPELAVIATRSHRVVARVPQASKFCPNLAVSPDGAEVWITLKDVGKVQAFEARPPYRLLRTLDTGPLTNHVALVRDLAYVSVGARDEVQVYRRADGTRLATVAVGALPHGVWPAADGARVWVGLEHDDALVAIDTTTQAVTARVPVGQGPQAIIYARAVAPPAAAAAVAPPAPRGVVTLGLVDASGRASGSVSLFDQGLTQLVQAAVSGLEPGKPYVLALASGGGALEPLAQLTANPAGAAVVNAVGPIRQLVRADAPAPRRTLVVAPLVDGKPGAIVLRQR